jgi:hypothetical protein
MLLNNPHKTCVEEDHLIYNNETCVEEDHLIYNNEKSGVYIGHQLFTIKCIIKHITKEH